METAKKVASPSVSELFASMEYGPAPEDASIVKAWIEDHDGGQFGHFINNKQDPKPMKRRLLSAFQVGKARKSFDFDLYLPLGRPCYGQDRPR